MNNNISKIDNENLKMFNLEKEKKNESNESKSIECETCKTCNNFCFIDDDSLGSENDIDNILNKKTKRINVKFKCKSEKKIVEENNYNLNKLNIEFYKDLITDSYINDIGLDNIFCIFNSINNILIIIYANNNQSIILFNIIDNKKINEIKNAHYNYITNFRHYLDKMKNRDLVISISGYDSNVKVWNINNLECLVNLEKIYKDGELYSACFINNNNKLYIITCHDNYPDKPDSIKVFNINGKKKKRIKESKERAFFIDSFYDKKNCNNYIIVGNKDYIKSYNFNNRKLFRKYCDNDYDYHCCIIINNDETEGIVKMIDSSNDGNIRIWNFHTAELISKLEIKKKHNYFHRLYGFCLYQNEYLFVGCNDKTIKVIKLNNGKIIKNLKGHIEFPVTIKKFVHPLYGDCLLSKGGEFEPIKLWTIKISN